ncbi:MAG TPA: LysR substrate-binding domain-containing protein [Polyangiaceae bacterium]|jgi:LysR family hydrogen peroxide-inducible transcriptional activator
MPIAIHDVSLRQLQYAVSVADELGFHKAAAKCHVSQPTLSAQVKQLEQVLGVALFERDKRRVLVTAAGETLVARARRVLVEVEDLAAAAERLREPFAGTLRVGVIPTIAPYLLPDVTPGLAKKWPKLRLVFREEKTADVVSELEGGRLDAGIVALEADLGDLAHEIVAKDPFVVALPKGHPLAKKSRVEVADLDREEVLLLDEGHCFRAQALALCERAGARENEFRATSLATLAQMVTSGAGLTLLPSIAVPVENRRSQLEIRPFKPPAPVRTIAVVFRKSSPLAPTIRALAAAMRATPRRKW